MKADDTVMAGVSAHRKEASDHRRQTHATSRRYQHTGDLLDA